MTRAPRIKLGTTGHFVSLFATLLVFAATLTAPNPLAAESWGMAIDLEKSQNGPFPLLQRKFIDPKIMDSLCRDGDGCTISLKIDGPGGVLAKTEWVFLSAFSPAYTTSTTINEPPFLDGDGLDRYLALVQRTDPQPAVGCGLTDEDDGPGNHDTKPGFGLTFWENGAGTGEWVCILAIRD